MEGRQYYPRENAAEENRTSAIGPHSPWHSPVPYLFGGLAAMLGLIAFALLILACSYWRLSGYLDGEENNGDQRDVEAGDGEKSVKPVTVAVMPEKFLVIMAGDVKPSKIATPVVVCSNGTSRFSTVLETEKSCTCDEDDDDDVEGCDQVAQRTTGSNGETH